MKNKRELLWDIVKGIGIISIVIGHVTPIYELYKFVYLYHLSIFYFIGTYFYNEEKYGDKPFENIVQRLKTNWSKYVFYSIILIFLHNTFVKYHFYNPKTKIYKGIKDYIYPILESMTFVGLELFSGALWFVFTLIVASGIFGGIIYISRKINNPKHKYVIIIILSIICGLIGVYLNENAISLNYHLHTAILIIPICALGHFVKQNENIIKKMQKWYISMPILICTMAFLIYLVTQTNMQIELSKEMIINGPMFYIVSCIGITFCISLSAIIEKIPVLNQAIALLGKHSFSIMALHFASVKLIDVIYSKMINETNPEVISRWVTSYPEKLWVIYVIAGCVIPLIFSMILEIIKKGEIRWKKKI